MNRELKFRYFWKGEWFYIDLYDVIVRAKFEAYECIDNASQLYEYTGLKDKNGKEIYEGDIILFKRSYNYSNGKNEFKAPVKFENGAFTIDILRSGLKTRGDYIHWGLASEWTLGTTSLNNGDGTMEVIGNIYENPKLLK